MRRGFRPARRDSYKGDNHGLVGEKSNQKRGKKEEKEQKKSGERKIGLDQPALDKSPRRRQRDPSYHSQGSVPGRVIKREKRRLRYFYPKKIRREGLCPRPFGSRGSTKNRSGLHRVRPLKGGERGGWNDPGLFPKRYRGRVIDGQFRRREYNFSPRGRNGWEDLESLKGVEESGEILSPRRLRVRKNKKRGEWPLSLKKNNGK